MSGFEALGDLIGGGLETRKENAFQQGRYRAAQTEDALTQARVNQAKALQAEAENNQRSELEAMRATGQIDFANPSNDLFARALLGGVTAGLPHISTAQLGAQEFRNRETLGDPTAPALDRARAGNAVEGNFEGDLKSLGQNGYYNITDDTPELSVMAGLGSSSPRLPSSAIQNFNQAVQLDPSILQLPPERQRAIFEQFVRADKLFNAGGVTNVVPGINPNQATPAKPVVDLATTATNAGEIERAKTTAKTQAKLAIALPGVVEGLDEFQSNIDKFLAEPGYTQVYGKSGAAARMSPTPLLLPEAYRNAKAKYDTLGGEAFLNTVQKMRGLGALSDAEGARVQDALSAALNQDQSEEAAAVSWEALKVRLDSFRRIAELEAGLKAVPGINVGAGAAPAAPAAPAALPPTNAKGWTLMQDGSGNKAYVGPNGEFEEVQ